MTDKDKPIYIIIGFPFPYINKQKKYLEFKKNDDKEGWAAWRKTNQFLAYLTSQPTFKGFYYNLDKAKDMIKHGGNYIHEGNYYPIFVIERYYPGYENLAIDNDSTIWYEGISTGEGWHDYEYREIPKPEYFQGICCFL